MNKKSKLSRTGKSEVKISEKDLQKSVLHYLRLCSWFAFKVNTTGIYKKATNSYIPSPNVGAPDILAFKNGYPALGVECKSTINGRKGQQSDEQKKWQANFEHAGGQYILAYSLKDVDEKMKI